MFGSGDESLPIELFILFSPSVAGRTVQFYFIYPSEVHEINIAKRAMELYTFFPAGVFDVDGLGRNGIEFAVSGMNSHPRNTPPLILPAFLPVFSYEKIYCTHPAFSCRPAVGGVWGQIRR